MNCIFVCVFNQSKYIEMFYLLLESILMYGNLKNTKIIVYTSTEFMNTIKSHYLYNNQLIFEINDNYNTVNLACKSRLDVFQLESVKSCEKILYLDTDILIQHEIEPIFDLCVNDILYAVEEGLITNEKDYYGFSLFGDEIHKYKDKSAFTSGILLFNNCEKIQQLFENIKLSFQTMIYKGPCNDQPYIIYNAFKYGLYNNKVLNNYVANYNFWCNQNCLFDLHSNKIIHHFPFGAGTFKEKLFQMNRWFTQVNNELFPTNTRVYNTYSPPLKNTTFPLVGICISYNYFDTLKFMLPANYLHFDVLYIITQEDDTDTIELCKNYSNVVVLFYTFKHGNKIFDKYGALNYAQKIVYETHPDRWYLIIDSDILLPTNFIHVLRNEKLNPNCIYGATRNNISTTKDLLNKNDIIRNHIHWRCNNILWKKIFQNKDTPPSILGCFQLYKKHCFHRDTFKDASEGDFVFCYDHFKVFCNLTNVSYFHMGEGAKNWKGKVWYFIDDIDIDKNLLFYNYINTNANIYYNEKCEMIKSKKSTKIQENKPEKQSYFKISSIVNYTPTIPSYNTNKIERKNIFKIVF